MGLRYRKSINLGGGFRINISQSGVGYSYGIKGFRVTKTAKGNVRTTASIPGTGVSFVDEKNYHKTPAVSNYDDEILKDNYYDSKTIENGDANEIFSVGLEDIINAARRVIIINNIITILIVISIIASFYKTWCLLITLLLLIIKLYVKTIGRVKIRYEIDKDQKEQINKKMEPWIRVNESEIVWRIIESTNIRNHKYTAGADIECKRVKCKTSKKAPFPFNMNIQVASFSSDKENLIFTPDKLFIIQGQKIGAINYSDIRFNVSTVDFREYEKVPKNAEIVGYTWKYVNQNGDPDKRFRNNKRIPICKYGEIVMRSTSGLNVDYMFTG